MTYSTIEDLKQIIPERDLINLTNDEVPARDIDEPKVNNAIEYADELINSYLRNKYTLPLKFTPLIIRKISSDIAAYRLYQRRPEKLPEHIKDCYKDALELLKNIQKEQMILDLPEEHPDKDIAKPAKMILTNKNSSSKIFSDNVLKGFQT